MNSSERFNQVHAEYTSKKATLTSEQFQAYADQNNIIFESTRGNQAYIDDSQRQADAQRALEAEVARRQAREDEKYDLDIMRAMLFAS